MGIIYKNGIPYGNQPSTDAVAMIEPSEEASATSAHAYAVGEHFIYNDTLYRATAAISIGDTITPGTNCVATNVMTEVESGSGGGGSEKLNSTQAADAYDPTATYAVGDKVSYAGNVYSCISAISTPEVWGSTHWDQVDPIQDQVDDVRNTLNQLCLRGQKTAISANGTTSNISCTGLTANHKVCNWGLFSDNDLTTPLDPNNPPADITITEKADAYDITITNFTSAFYIQPIFIIPQN